MDKKLHSAVQAIKTEMERQELSIPKLAEMSGITPQALYDIFNGASPNLARLERLAKSLNMKVEVA